jgi:hypothetical protein
MGSTGNQAKDPFSWQQVVTAVAAAAGGAAWVSAVGSGVVALRLRQADLPIEPVVALMSTEHRFAIGAGILVLPLFVGFIGFLADLALGSLTGWPSRDTEDHHRRQLLALITVLVGVALMYFVLKPPFETFVFAGVAVAVVVPVAFEVLQHTKLETRAFYERLAVFLSVLVAAGAGAILAESFGSPSFDETKITIRDRPSPVRGGYITSTEHSVVVSTRCEVIEAVPRDRIERISVGPDEVTRTHC